MSVERGSLLCATNEGAVAGTVVKSDIFVVVKLLSSDKAKRLNL